MSEFVYTSGLEPEVSHALIGAPPDCVTQIVGRPDRNVTYKRSCSKKFFCFDYQDVFDFQMLSVTKDRITHYELTVVGAELHTTFAIDGRVGFMISGGEPGGYANINNLIHVGPFIFSGTWLIHVT